MNSFDKQLRTRGQSDNESFAEAIDSIVSAVLGKRLRNALSDSEVLNDVLDEIIKAYGFQVKPVKYDTEGKTVEQIIEDRLRPYGIRNRRVILEKGWRKNAIGAMLTFVKEDDTVVALIPTNRSRYTMVDIKSGKRIPVTANTEEMLSEEAICFYRPFPNTSLKVKDLLIYMAQQIRTADIVQCIVVMFIVSFIGLLLPLFTKMLFGSVLEAKRITPLISLAVFAICYAICQILLNTYQTLTFNKIGIEQDLTVQAALMSRVISLPASFFKKYSAGELSQRMSYINQYCTLIFGTIGMIAISAVFVLMYIGEIAVLTPSLAVPAFLISLITLVFSLATTFAQMKRTQKEMELSSKISGLTYGTLSGIEKIKLAGAEKRMFSRWGKQYSRQAQLEYNPPFFLKISGAISTMLSLSGTLVLYAVAIKNKIPVEDYYAFTTSYAMVSSAFMAVNAVAKDFGQVKPVLEMVRPIMEAEPEITDNKDIINEISGNIEISHLTFKYEDLANNVIDDLSLNINPGEYVAIVGTTGCGKSTLIRLILGFEKPDRGTILFDGRDISTINLESLRQKIGTVTQDGKLFSGDIFSNITITLPEASVEQAWEAAEVASIAEDIRNMPMGMQTYISEGQGGISGGQKQRLMIARAVVSKPNILIFDEATSALDNITQKKISDAIDNLNCTRIVIAHRLSTIQHADRIIFLDGGKIVEDGTYDELIALNGLFANLVERQRLDK